jgi:ribose-phosphate pyrophosphokinase
MEGLFHTNDRGRLSVIACDSGRAFATGLAEALSRIILEADGEAQAVTRLSDEVRFANGETKTVVRESIRGDDVYIVQCVDDPLSPRSVNDNLMALLTAINAVYQSDPDSITAVIPQFPYARQDRKRAREPITARVVAAALEDVGAGRIITLDIHAPAIEGFFRRAVLENLHASKEIIAFLRRSIPLDRLCVLAPDTGRAQMARDYSRTLNCDFAVADKARDYTTPSAIESMRLVGDVTGRQVIIPDDMVATGETLLNSCRLVLDKGASDVYVVCSHPSFNGDAVEKLDRGFQDGLFRMIVGTDAVWRGSDFIREHEWYREVSLAGLFARVIFNINRRRSVAELLD